MHPTPLYEFAATLLIFLLLWTLRKKERPTGWIFALYLVFAGLERLLVEFIRLNPLYWGLSQAQWISLAMIVAGTLMILKRRSAAPVMQEAARSRDLSERR